MQIGSYYFWKWADNDLPGRPAEVHAALLRGEWPPALQPFDARPLLRKLEQAAAAGRRRGEEWDWQVVSDRSGKLASFVFVTSPVLDFPDAVRWRMCKRFFSLDVSGCDAESGQLIDFFLPKQNSFESGQDPDNDLFDLEPNDLPALIRSISASEPDPFAILTNRRNHFVQFCKVGHRYRVEWRENYLMKVHSPFDQWAAEYSKESTVARKFAPPGCRDIRHHEGGAKEIETKGKEELLRHADTLRIFEAFVRGERRPSQYRWININHMVS